MSSQVTTAFVQQYSANVQMLSQQMGSRLRDAVRIENVVGKNAFIDQIGKATAQLRTSRHADTPQLDTPHARRRLSLASYEYADLIDDQDKVRMLIDPTSFYAQAAAAAMGRAMDDVIIAAALGTASTGETGSGSATLDATNDEVLNPLQKPSLLVKIKFDLSSVKLDSVFTIFLSLEAEVSNLDKYLILSLFSM